MEIIISGQLLDVKMKEVEKDGNKKVYCSLDIYNERLYNVGIPLDMVKEYQAKIGQKVKVTDVSIWSKGSYSLFVRS